MTAMDYKPHQKQMTLGCKENYKTEFSSSSSLSGDNLRPKNVKEQEGFNAFAPSTTPVNFVFFRDKQDVLEKFLKERQTKLLYATMSSESEVVITHDPMVEILNAFYSIPSDYHADLFKDFRDVADAQDLRGLLDAISDWAATAELYAHPSLANDLREAIGGREGVADWLPG